MNTRHLFFLFVMPICCLAKSGKIPARDYKMVDLHNGLTTELLAVGPTSITFSVEMSPQIERDRVPQFYLIGKLDIKKRGWHWLTYLTFEPSHGKSIFEVPYNWLVWYDMDEYKSVFEEKAWFAVRVPRGFYEERDPALEYSDARGMYEEDDEEEPLPVTTAEAQEEKTATPHHPHFWLYVGGVLLLALTLSALFRLTQKRR